LSTASQVGILDIIALLKHATMSASYKPALLRAIVECVQRNRIENGRILLVDLAEQFLGMYWTQTVVFRFRHSPRTAAQPEIVQRMSEVADATGIRQADLLPAMVRTKLVTQLSRVLTINVLQAFHTSKPVQMSPLYSWEKEDDSIEVSVESEQFIRANAEALKLIANYYWARFLTRLNASPRLIDKIERDKPRRAALHGVAAAMVARGETMCFYCGVNVGPLNRIHVDHFIPWTFVFEDKPWNLVAACEPCNLKKADTLPAEPYLQRLIELNRRRWSLNENRTSFMAAGVNPEEQLKELYGLALSAEWPAGWAAVVP